MNEQAQTAVEFIILVGFVLFFFSVFFLLINENMSEKISEKKNLALKEIALSVQHEINLALESSDGYFREFEIPKSINGQDYEVNIQEGSVYVRTSDNKHALALPVAEVSGDVVKGKNKIKKENGEILLNL